MYKLTQTAVNFAVGQVQCMVNFALEDIKNSVQRPSNDELGCLSLNIDPFEDLHSEYRPNISRKTSACGNHSTT